VSLPHSTNDCECAGTGLFHSTRIMVRGQFVPRPDDQVCPTYLKDQRAKKMKKKVAKDKERRRVDPVWRAKANAKRAARAATPQGLEQGREKMARFRGTAKGMLNDARGNLRQQERRLEELEERYVAS
jgi:hypothetical protein